MFVVRHETEWSAVKCSAERHSACIARSFQEGLSDRLLETCEVHLQAALHGLLNGIRDLGLPLLLIQRASPNKQRKERLEMGGRYL